MTIHVPPPPCSLHIQYIDHHQNNNQPWIGQESKIRCDQNQVLLLLMKDETIYFWCILLHCHTLYQALQLTSTCDKSMFTFFPQHLQTILKLILFIDGYWSNLISILVLAKSASSISWWKVLMRNQIQCIQMYARWFHEHQCIEWITEFL